MLVSESALSSFNTSMFNDLTLVDIFYWQLVSTLLIQIPLCQSGKVQSLPPPLAWMMIKCMGVSQGEGRGCRSFQIDCCIIMMMMVLHNDRCKLPKWMLYDDQVKSLLIIYTLYGLIFFISPRMSQALPRLSQLLPSPCLAPQLQKSMTFLRSPELALLWS